MRKTAYEILEDIEARAERAGFRIADLCRESGIAHPLVSRWRKKLYEPRLSSLHKLEDALDSLLSEPTSAAPAPSLADLL
jgi:transcriptional regulator with XRE-family HTH domain